MITYTASSQPRRGHGFNVATTSRAGYAEGKWQIIEGRIKLTIEHSMSDDRGSPAALVGEALFGGTVKFDVVLEPSPLLAGQFRGGTTVVRQMAVTHVTARCRGAAWQREAWDISAGVNWETKTLDLHASMFLNDSSGQWTCGTDGLDVVEIAEVGRLAVPAIIGSPQTFQVPRQDRNHETLTVTVLESPVAR